MRRVTIIKAGSCSRTARPRKALGACAQVSPSSTPSPKRGKGTGRGLSPVFAELQQIIASEFKQGDSVYTLATRHGVTVQTVERLIRNHMIEGPSWEK
jgi:hypothetical protein